MELFSSQQQRTTSYGDTYRVVGTASIACDVCDATGERPNDVGRCVVCGGSCERAGEITVWSDGSVGLGDDDAPESLCAELRAAGVLQ